MKLYQILQVLLLLHFAIARVQAAAPALVSPGDTATNQPAQLTLAWQAGPLTNCVADGGFEAGGQQWSMLSLWHVAVDSGTAYVGSHYVEIPMPGHNLNGHSEAIMFQTVKLPKTGSGARLQWWDYTSSSEVPGDQPHFKVDVNVVGTQAIEVVYDTPCGEANIAPWNRHELDFSRYLGKTIYLTFSVTNEIFRTAYFLARVDEVRLEILPGSVEYEVYLGSTADLGPADLLGKTADISWGLSGLAAASTNYWKVIQITDGVRESSPVFQFVVGGSVPVEAPPLLAGLNGGQLHLHARTQA